MGVEMSLSSGILLSFCKNQINQKRSAKQRCEDADRKFGLGNAFCKRVCGEQKKTADRTAQKTAGAPVMPAEYPCCVRGEETDEADQTGDADDGGDSKRCEKQKRHPHRSDRDPEHACFLLVHGEHQKMTVKRENQS